jgi:hypothetical protein
VSADDRTVHAKLPMGGEVVRYERAGKWFIEWPAQHMILARHVGVDEAARTAVGREGFVHFDRPGGRVFERKVRSLRGGVSPSGKEQP